MNAELLKKINEEIQNGASGALCTVVRETGSTPRSRGASMWVRQDGSIAGTIGGGLIEYEAIQRALELMKSGETSTLWHKSLNAADGMVCGGEADVFIELLGLGDELVIFGAGHVGRATAELGAFAGFRVTVWDERPEFANDERIPWARNIVCPIEKVYENGLSLHNRSYVVIMTRGHALDAEAVRVTEGHPGAYYGMIGSRSKIAAVRAKLLAEGVSAAHLDRIYQPIGLPIKAETPNEIAVSIMSEIIAVKYGADVKRLRGETAAR